jgi:hypothetical protein
MLSHLLKVTQHQEVAAFGPEFLRLQVQVLPETDSSPAFTLHFLVLHSGLGKRTLTRTLIHV